MRDREKEHRKAIEKIQAECKKYGYETEYKFDEVFIKTRFENWKVCVNKGFTKLSHMNVLQMTQGIYHIQFEKKISATELIRYIHNHETAKYIGKPKLLKEEPNG